MKVHQLERPQFNSPIMSIHFETLFDMIRPFLISSMPTIQSIFVQTSQSCSSQLPHIPQQIGSIYTFTNERGKKKDPVTSNKNFRRKD